MADRELSRKDKSYDRGKGLDAMRYQLRYAAGLYWLLDMEQPGVPYRKPLSMNKAGADIYRMMGEGRTREQIAEALCGEYQMPMDVILPDVEQFQAQLEKYCLGDEGADGMETDVSDKKGRK